MTRTDPPQLKTFLGARFSPSHLPCGVSSVGCEELTGVTKSQEVLQLWRA